MTAMRMHSRVMMKFKRLLIALALAAALMLLAARSSAAAELARNAITVCARSVAPSLFPFFVVCSLVTGLGYASAAGRFAAPLMQRIFGVGGGGAAALVLGLIGGYPTGARTVSELYTRGECSRAECERLLMFCNNCGPAFILGIAGSATFGGAEYGWFLLAVHVVSVLVLGAAVNIVSRFGSSGNEPNRPDERGTSGSSGLSGSRGRPASFAAAFVSSVTGALGSTLTVCAFVVFFGIVSGLAGLPGAVLPGILEMTGGIMAIPGAGMGIRAGLAAASLILGFGGLSVHCQALSFILPAGLDAKKYLFGKLLHGLLAAALAYAVCPWA